MKIGNYNQQVNFYGYAVNSNGIIGEVAAIFNSCSEIRKRFDASCLYNLT